MRDIEIARNLVERILLCSMSIGRYSEQTGAPISLLTKNTTWKNCVNDTLSKMCSD